VRPELRASASKAEITYDEEENEDGYEVPCVYATCLVTGEQAGPIWGDGEASVLRALATLTEVDGCKWHVAAE
jgi:hypothetical protein